MISSSLTVFRYELKKSFGIGTTIFWLFVILFPTILQLLIIITLSQRLICQQRYWQQ